MALRRAIFWIHLIVGIAGAIVIFMMAVTGLILSFEAPFSRWALQPYLADPPPDAVPLSLDQLIERVVTEKASRIVTSATLTVDSREPAVLRLDNNAAILVDRFTGEPLGDANTRTRRFFRSVMYWHRWFALDGEYRIIGRTFTATSNLGFLFLLVSGLFLWWPTGRNRAAWRRVLWFRRGLRRRARNFNWHSVIGFWSALPLLIIVASGATFSYQWAANLVYRLAGEVPPSQMSSGSSATEPGRDLSANNSPPTSLQTLQALTGKAVSERPGWRTITVRVPKETHLPVSITVDRGNGRQPSKTEDLLFDWKTGELVGRGGYPTFSRGHRIRRWLRFAHTGEIYGVIGQSVAAVVSLGTAVIVWTGLAMSWRRFVRPRRRG